MINTTSMDNWFFFNFIIWNLGPWNRIDARIIGPIDCKCGIKTLKIPANHAYCQVADFCHLVRQCEPALYLNAHIFPGSLSQDSGQGLGQHKTQLAGLLIVFAQQWDGMIVIYDNFTQQACRRQLSTHDHSLMHPLDLPDHSEVYVCSWWHDCKSESHRQPAGGDQAHISLTSVGCIITVYHVGLCWQQGHLRLPHQRLLLPGIILNAAQDTCRHEAVIVAGPRGQPGWASQAR